MVRVGLLACVSICRIRLARARIRREFLERGGRDRDGLKQTLNSVVEVRRRAVFGWGCPEHEGRKLPHKQRRLRRGGVRAEHLPAAPSSSLGVARLCQIRRDRHVRAGEAPAQAGAHYDACDARLKEPLAQLSLAFEFANNAPGEGALETLVDERAS